MEIAFRGILESQKLRCYNGSMQKNVRSLADLTNAELITEVKALASGEREATARLIVSLAELDVRRLYLGEGFPSLFTYCTQCLHLSEHAAYNRIEAARAARQWPEIHQRLAEGTLTLTSVRLLAPHLTTENSRRVLDAARHKSKREVEHLVAGLHPMPDVPATIRRLPVPKSVEAPIETARLIDAPPSVEPDTSLAQAFAPAHVAEKPIAAVLAKSQAAPPPRPGGGAPLALDRYKVQVTVSRQTHDKLRRAQDLLRHVVPNGDPAEIFDRALTLLVEHLERTKLASTLRPRPPRPVVAESRHIPSTVKRAVWERDGARCAFVGGEGRCAERGFLELHHVVPYARGGVATEENIQLRCRAHNQYEAEAVFGARDLFYASSPRV